MTPLPFFQPSSLLPSSLPLSISLFFHSLFSSSFRCFAAQPGCLSRLPLVVLLWPCDHCVLYQSVTCVLAQPLPLPCTHRADQCAAAALTDRRAAWPPLFQPMEPSTLQWWEHLLTSLTKNTVPIRHLKISLQIFPNVFVTLHLIFPGHSYICICHLSWPWCPAISVLHKSKTLLEHVIYLFDSEYLSLIILFINAQCNYGARMIMLFELYSPVSQLVCINWCCFLYKGL